MAVEKVVVLGRAVLSHPVHCRHPMQKTKGKKGIMKRKTLKQQWISDQTDNNDAITRTPNRMQMQMINERKAGAIGDMCS